MTQCPADPYSTEVDYDGRSRQFLASPAVIRAEEAELGALIAAAAEADQGALASLHQGDYYRAPRATAHGVTHTEGGCTFLLIASRLELLETIS